MSARQRRIKVLKKKIVEADKEYIRELFAIGGLYYSMHPGFVAVTQDAINRRCGMVDALCVKIGDYESQIKEIQS